MASKAEWNSFFLDAKIPKDVAARYAVNFYNNRMSFDMLADLNKDYLRDLDITVLGDVISILKHAKEAKNKQESDVFMVSEVKKITPVVASSVQPVKEAEKNVRTVTNVTNDKKSEVSSRLGPPKPMKFGASSSPVNASPANVPDSNKKSAIFARLADKTKESSTSPLTKIHPKIKVTLDETKTVSQRSVNTIRNDQSERSRNLLKRSIDSSSATKDEPKKKYFVYKTFSDGTRVKEYLNEDEVQKNYASTVSKKMKMMKGENENSSVKNMLLRKNISPSPRPREPRNQDVHSISRSGSKTTTANTISRITLNADKNSEQQKSIKSRLSLPSSGSLGSASIKSVAAVPKARSRITYSPMDNDKRSHSLNDRLGPKVPKARTRITAPEGSDEHDDHEDNDDNYYRALNRSSSSSINHRIGNRLNKSPSINDRIGNRVNYKRN